MLEKTHTPASHVLDAACGSRHESTGGESLRSRAARRPGFFPRPGYVPGTPHTVAQA